MAASVPGDSFHSTLQSVTAYVTQHRFSAMTQYNGKAIIPLDEVGRDFFPHLALPKFQRQLSSGDIALPLMQIETSQKYAKDIHLQDLADYLDRRRQAAQGAFSRRAVGKVEV